MGNNILQTNQLSYYFGKFQALNAINLKVDAQQIMGFLGQNGAGKTTTIKIILGLLHAPAESVHVFGKSIRTHRIEILSKIGSMVENPAIYEHLSARENLLISTTMLGIKKAEITRVLQTVGLDKTGSKPAKAFSHGMKQRLGIAKALISNPELLILDEPTNGLDPQGIIEIRELVKKLNIEEGKTVLISSHILSEVEKMCTHVGIIHQGSLLFQGSMQELLMHNKPRLHIKSDQPANTLQICHNLGMSGIKSSENGVETDFVSDTQTSELVKTLVQKQISIFAVEQKKPSLEELFMNVTSANNE